MLKRIIGVWNGMIKRESFADKVSGEPMNALSLSHVLLKIANVFLDNLKVLLMTILIVKKVTLLMFVTLMVV